MKLGYILESFPKLSETFILEELLELEKLGFEITIFALSDPHESRVHQKVAQLKSPIVRPAKSDLLRGFSGVARLLSSAGSGWGTLPLKKLLWGWATASWLAQEAKQRGLVHLHAHFGGDAAWVAMLAARLSKIPYSFTVHAVDIFAWPYLIREKLAGAQFVAAISEFNRSFLVDNYQLDEEAARKIHVIHCGVDLESFQFRGEPEHDVPRILSVGRLEEKKGHAYLLQALRILVDQEVDFRCQIVGGGVLESALKKQVADLDLDDRVVFSGPLTQSEVLTLLQDADLFVLPCVQAANGDMDGIPVSLMEAMAMGVPVISTQLSGIPELIEDEVSGRLVAPQNAGALAEAISGTLANLGLRQNYAAAGRRKVEAEFDIVSNAAKLAKSFGEASTGDPRNSDPGNSDQAPSP